VGFETLNQAALDQANKHHNKIADYEVGIENAHRAGIHILGSLVIGFEDDKTDAFEKIVEFTDKTNLSFVMINALTTYPGTDLYERMKAQKRITKYDPDLLNGIYPTMHYRHFTQEELVKGILSTLDRVYSFETLVKKAPAVLGNGGFTDLVQPQIHWWVKVRSMIHLLFRYLLSFNKLKRRLLILMFRLVKEKRVDRGAVIQYLLFITAIHGYQAFNKRQVQKILPKLQENDRARPIAF
jgi:radical SAM superfamily enzyme YgiQ (UPF0313 family)